MYEVNKIFYHIGQLPWPVVVSLFVIAFSPAVLVVLKAWAGPQHPNK